MTTLRPFLLLGASLLLGAALRAAAPTPASPFSLRLLQDEALWGDNLAEFSIYNAEERRYGINRPTQTRHILVRESFRPDRPVKADDWRMPGAYPVLKLNQVVSIPTGTYSHELMHSAFWRVSDGGLALWSVAVHDSCGNTFKRGTPGPGGRWEYLAFTYWDGMDRVGRRDPVPAEAIFYDELPLRLRLLRFGEVTAFEAPLGPSVMNSKAEALAFGAARFTATRTDGGWQVEVEHRGGRDRLVFAADYPHVLQLWERADTTRLRLRSTQRIAYWEHSRPGDERLLAPARVTR